MALFTYIADKNESYNLASCKKEKTLANKGVWNIPFRSKFVQKLTHGRGAG